MNNDAATESLLLTHPTSCKDGQIKAYQSATSYILHTSKSVRSLTEISHWLEVGKWWIRPLSEAEYSKKLRSTKQLSIQGVVYEQ